MCKKQKYFQHTSVQREILLRNALRLSLEQINKNLPKERGRYTCINASTKELDPQTWTRYQIARQWKVKTNHAKSWYLKQGWRWYQDRPEVGSTFNSKQDVSQKVLRVNPTYASPNDCFCPATPKRKDKPSLYTSSTLGYPEQKRMYFQLPTDRRAIAYLQKSSYGAYCLHVRVRVQSNK